MSVLMSITFGQRALSQIELVLTKEPSRYTVAVSDSEGLLHLTEFTSENHGGDAEDACEAALDWFDTVHAAIAQYIEQSGSQAIRQLVNTLH